MRLFHPVCSYGAEILFSGVELMVCVFGDVGKGFDRNSRYLGPSGNSVGIAILE